MHRQVGTAFFQCHFKLFHKQALAAHFAQRAVQNLITLGGHAQETDLIPQLSQKCLDMLSLPKGQPTFARGDGDV